MAQAGATGGAPPEVARAHHGSVSRQERAQIEEALKAGRLPAVVATSSLELGIDMGAVDLVVQVESPPSVASGLQRTGRAGHNVGDVSRGVIFPKYQGDLVQAAVVARRMRDGQIEELSVPRNPLDVLAQQIVAMTAMDDWAVGDLEQVVRRAAPFASLTRPVLEAVLDMLAGRYPSEEFAELRPRLVWDRTTGTLHGRPGAQRLAVTSGGTIPDRGLFGVFLAASQREASGRNSHRVGELDEEMVYESRVGDVFVLGASSWRIEDITADQVLVSPAPGQPGKLPFWHGDAPGRPVELGRALGAYCRELASRVRAGRHQPAARRRPGRAGRHQPGALPGRPARGDRLPAGRPHPGPGAVPGRAGRLAAGAAQPVRRAGARALGAGHRGPAARALPGHGRAGHAHRRRHRDPGAGHRRAAAERPGRAGPGGGGAAGHRRAGQLGAVRVAVPRVRGPGAAAAPPPARPAQPAVAAAAAVRAAAVGGPQVRHVPDRAGDGAGVPAGRIRRARPGRPDARAGHPADPAGRGGDTRAIPVRPVHAVPLRRRVHVRGGRPGRGTPRPGPGAGLGPAGRVARPGRPARAARPGGGGRDRAGAAAAAAQPGLPGRRGRG